MNLTFAQFLNKGSRQNGRHPSRVVLAVLCMLLFNAVPAFADPVRVNQVIQTLTSSQGAPDLKLKSLVSQQQDQKTQNGPRNDNATAQTTKPDSVISGVVVTGEGKSLGVEVIEEAEVEGTICDCGEILVAGGAFPKWPFMFLAAVPLVFIHDCDDCDNETSSPTPTPTPTPTPPSTPTPTPPGVPEPASLLLLGTGLAAFGAGVRRRYSKTKAVEQTQEEESDSEI